MRYFQPFFTISMPVFSIVSRTEKAILLKHKKDTPESDYVWVPQGWIHDIKYRKHKDSNGKVTGTKATIYFYGFLESEIKQKMAHLMKKPKAKKK
jgi:hypothetical protein